METALNQLRQDGDFTKFAAATKTDWTQIAKYLMKRWDCPAAVEVEDVTQELMFYCWQFVPKFDESRGIPFSRFIIWNSIEYAKKWMHGQRGALRLWDKSKSRHPIAFSNIFDGVSNPEHGSQSPWQESTIATIEAIEVRVRNKPKIKETIGCLFESLFDKNKAVELMVSNGYKQYAAQKLVNQALDELKAAV